MLELIREDMFEITHKPGIRSAILLLSALADHGVTSITPEVMSRYLGCIARDADEVANLGEALGRLTRVANAPKSTIDQWTRTRKQFERAQLTSLDKEEAA